MKVKELILQSEEIIKCLAEGINRSETSLKEAEERILVYINRLGQIMVDEVVERVSEPVIDRIFYNSKLVNIGKKIVKSPRFAYEIFKNAFTTEKRQPSCEYATRHRTCYQE